MDKNWQRQNINAAIFLCHFKAANKVKIMKTKTAIVAIILVSLNIFLICFHGPIKKHVEAMERKFPVV